MGLGLNFSHYNNPARAEAVYMAYERDIARLDLQDRAQLITESCRTFRGLDIALDKLISSSKSHKTRGRNKSWY